MTEKNIRDLLEQVSQGLLSPEKALGKFRDRPLNELAQGITLDAHRLSRTGVGEVVFATGKTPSQIVTCVQGLQGDSPVLVTRVDETAATALTTAYPEGHHDEPSGLFVLGTDPGLTPPWPETGEVLVVTAGTSDMRVALEAYGTAQFLGLGCGLIADVGVAGVHRLTPHLPALRSAQVVIAVAGMDGALPSVLAGLLPTPVVAVPSSQNSGNPLGGIASLLAMLNSCSPGITVCNIDNGFGAAAFAAKMLKNHPTE